MNVFLSKSGNIIFPHLEHVLKSYYYTTGYGAYAYDNYGSFISSHINPQLDGFKFLLDDLAKSEIIEYINNSSCEELDTLIFEISQDIVCLIAPIFQDNELKLFLMTQPLMLTQFSSVEKKDIFENRISSKCLEMDYSCFLHLNYVNSDRLDYLGQLFFHLTSNSIYIGQQHFEPKTSMEDTKWGDIISLDIWSDKELINPDMIRKVCEYLVLKDIDNALRVYRLIKIFYKTSDIEICQIKLLKYKLLYINILMQAYLSESFKEWRIDIAKISMHCLFTIDRCNRYNQLLKLDEWVIESYWKLIKSKDKNKFSENIYAAIQYIHKHYTENIKLSDAAQHIHINETYLSTSFKKECNMSFTKYLNNYRINQAITLLENTNYNFTEIAMQVGFESANYFSTVFKKETGYTPSKYKCI